MNRSFFPPDVARDIVRRGNRSTDERCNLCGAKGRLTSVKKEKEYRTCPRCGKNFNCLKKH